MPGRPSRLLTIAGSDSGGGAGIQADLKAFARCGAHGMTAITAITAQNTVEVATVHPVPPEVIIDQVAVVARDIGVDAVKIGMLGDVPTIEAVAAALDLVGDVPVVIDPVMVSESGATLLQEEAIDALRILLVPRAAVITPNVPEARVLAGVGEEVAVGQLARAVYELGSDAVVVTGGHRDEAIDVYFDGRKVKEIRGDHHPGGAAHGSGCTHSSVLAAGLAVGLPEFEAARRAKEIASEAVRVGLRDIGCGPGPVNVLGIE